MRILLIMLWLAFMVPAVRAGSYALTDGSSVVGEAESYKDEGVLIRKADGTYWPLLRWGRFTEGALRQLYAEATTPAEKALMEPLLQDLPSEQAPMPEIKVQAVETPARPTGHLGLLAIVTSPMGWVVLLVLYGANLFAAYEVAIYRNIRVDKVCGLAAIPLFGVGSPIYFLAKPSRAPLSEDASPAGAVESFQGPIALPSANARAAAQQSAPPSANPEAAAASSSASAPQAAAAALPAPTIYQRGEFSFNRRFFETKLPGFFRVVLSEADKNMVILVKSSRGNFTGKRIPRITQTELYLQVFKDEASSEEMIPFAEIQEVQVRHKDLP